MAQTAYTKEELELQDGTVVEIKPLVISRMRKFSKLFEKLAEVDTEDEAEEMLIKMTLICLGPEQSKPYQYDSTVDEETNEPKGFDKAYDTFDNATIVRIIKVSTGVDLGMDPKEMEQRMSQMTEEGGMTT